jgi:IS1 family transposase
MHKTCYYCGSVNIVKNGHTYYGKQRGKCKDCTRQFVFERKNHSLNQQQKKLIEKLLLERISLQGICRVLNISAYLLYNYIEELYQTVPDHLYAQLPDQAQLDLKVFECEADEPWSFVGSKANKKWLAQNRTRKQIIAIHIGSRAEKGAKGLWEKIPLIYRQKAQFFTDQWEAYKKVIPAQKHQTAQKKDTNHVERFFCTLRQRCARLVRKALSFSKKETRHLMAIRFFIAHYNLSLRL